MSERAEQPGPDSSRAAGAPRDVPESLRARIYHQVRDVPAGEVITYGEVARLCGTIPLLVGKALAACPADVPWHRVIGAGGTLPIARRGESFAAEQRRRLEAEGIPFLPDGRVDLRPAPDHPAFDFPANDQPG